MFSDDETLELLADQQAAQVRTGGVDPRLLALGVAVPAGVYAAARYAHHGLPGLAAVRPGTVPRSPMMVSGPYADQYLERFAVSKGYHAALLHGADPVLAAHLCGLSPDEFRATMRGIAVRKRLRKAGGAVRRGARGAVRTTTRATHAAARTTARAATATARVTKKAAKKVGRGAAIVAKKAAYVAATPIRLAFNKVVAAKARKIAARKRTPVTPAVKAEARNWTLAALRAKGPVGKTVAAIATISGQPNHLTMAGWSMGIEPATITAITGAAVALLTVVLKAVMAEKSTAPPSGAPGEAAPGEVSPGRRDLPPVDADAAPEEGIPGPQHDADAAPEEVPLPETDPDPGEGDTRRPMRETGDETLEPEGEEETVSGMGNIDHLLYG